MATEKFAGSKHSKRYWLGRVYKPEIRRADGARSVSDNYAVRLLYGGKEARLSLNTPNQEQAAELAREWFVYLSAHGWPAFLAKYRNPDRPPDPALNLVRERKAKVTLGEFLAAVVAESELAHKTIKDYATTLRFIVSEIYEMEKVPGRCDYRKGGRQAWTKRIEAIPLEGITPDKIRLWKRDYVARAGRDELARRRRTVSCNSYLRRARALFAPKVLARLRSIELPATFPFSGVALEPRTDTKFYGAGVDPVSLVRAAIDELALERTEELKAFLLGITLGLRRKEMDMIEWSSVDFVTGTLRILPTKWYKLKTNESAAELPIEPEILELFRGWRARARGEFILESDRAPKSVNYQHYRCQETFVALLGWLRAKGVQGNKPLHTMRKLYGSALADLHGLHAASSGLRHADVRTTAAFYADRRVKVTPGFGSAISGSSSVTAFPLAAAEDRTGRKA